MRKKFSFFVGCLCLFGLTALSTRHIMSDYGVANSNNAYVLAQTGTTGGGGTGGGSGGGETPGGGSGLCAPSENWTKKKENKDGSGVTVLIECKGTPGRPCLPGFIVYEYNDAGEPINGESTYADDTVDCS